MTTNTTGKARPKMDVYKTVTAQIVMRLAKGDIPWRKPWNAPGKGDIINYESRTPYHGINRWLLDRPGEYMTFNQCRKNGGTIRKGEKGHLIVKYGMFVPKERKAEAERLKKEGKDISRLEIPYIQHNWVFHISQCEGIESKCPHEECSPAENPTDKADYIIDRYTEDEKVTVSEEARDSLFYDENTDTVHVPMKEQFVNEEEHYNAVFAGLIGSTAGPGRCDRKTDRPEKEELVREIGASMTLSGVGLARKEASENTAAKCKEWIDLLNKDFRMIISVSSQAEKAARYILKPLLG